MKKYRFYLCVVLACLISIILTACAETKNSAVFNESKDSNDKIVLKMLSLSARPSIVNMVTEFNNNNDNYVVELEEVFPYEENVSDADWNNAILKLNARIISGDLPDIIDLWDLPAEIYYQKGLLEDLFPYIDNDIQLQQEGYFENVFDAMSIDDRLPYITDCVVIYTMTTDLELSQNKQGWTLNDMQEIFSMQGNSSVGNLSGVDGMTGNGFIAMMLTTHNSYIDWETGECDFNTEEFVSILEIAKRIQKGFIPSYAEPGSYDPFLVSYETVFSACQIHKFQEYYDGNLNLVGFPDDSKEIQYTLMPQTKIAISSVSHNKEGAWEFVRRFLTEDHQKSCSALPINRAAFNAVMQTDIDGTSSWAKYYGVKATLEDVALTEMLVSNSHKSAVVNNTVSEIVFEEAEKFFSGVETAQDAAERIQAKVKIYLSEQLDI